MVLATINTLNLVSASSNITINTVEATSYGESRNTWIKKGNDWYYVNDSGAKETGWLKVSNKWYYMDTNGVMQTGWEKVGNRWYYMNASGAMQTGWNKVGNRWYYMQANGAMNSKTGWNKIGRNWYYQLSSGAMDTGWRKVSGKWYYLQSNAIMQTGWLKLGNSWYYLDNSGAMQTGQQEINGKSYYFNASGRMQSTAASAADSTAFNLAAIQQEFHKLVNQERVANGKRKIAYLHELNDAASTRAYEVREVGGLFSHTRPNGTSFRTVHNKLNDFNSGENALRFSQFNTVSTNKRIAERMFSQWKDSPGHYANMLSDHYTHHSLGVYLEKNGSFTNYNGIQLLYIAR